MCCFKRCFFKWFVFLSVVVFVFLAAVLPAKCAVTPPSGVNVFFLSTPDEIAEKAKVDFSVDTASGAIHASCNFPQYTEPVDIFIGITSPGRIFYYPDSSDVLKADVGGFKAYATSVTKAVIKNFDTSNMNFTTGVWWVNWIVKPSGADWSNYEFGGYKVVVDNGVVIGTISGDSNYCLSNQNYYDCITSCTTPECSMYCVNHGGFANLTISLTNKLSRDVEFIFTAGTMFTPDNAETQTMMVMLDKTVIVPPGTSTFCIPTFCLNQSLSSPGPKDVFHQSGQISKSCLIKIIDMTKGKKIMEPIKVQTIIWHCLDDAVGVSGDEWDYLKNLK